MKQTARITVHSHFGCGEEHDETFEQHTGSIILSERGILLQYRTNEPCDVQISASGERITIRRKGAVESTMVLCKGTTHPMAYTTAMGTLRLATHTHELSFPSAGMELPTQPGEIRARYDLMHEGTVASEHRLCITFEIL